MTRAQGITDAEGHAEPLGGKYLVFLLEGREYALDILRVREIVGARHVRPPSEPRPHLAGFMNIRGTEVPVLDIRRRHPDDDTRRADTCTIIALTDEAPIGIVAKEIIEVRDINGNDIRREPVEDPDVPEHFIDAVARIENRTCILLDLPSVFDEAQLDACPVGQSAAPADD
jgi:purine-binding chemotaxis protein CheW